MSYVTVAKVSDIAEGTMKRFVVGGVAVLVVNCGGTFYAIGGRCTHLGGALSRGRLEGTTVVCPRHGSRFDVTTGASINGPHFGPLKLNTRDEPAYQVTVEGDEVKVALP
jgi:3-phenylpropionate/trans-cinnamate dioxygenase ferredoxin component